MDSSRALCCGDGFVIGAVFVCLLAAVADGWAGDLTFEGAAGADREAVAEDGGPRAGRFSFESAGARFGGGASSSNGDFHQVEAFVDWNLPWRWDLGKKWGLESRLDLSAGWLGNSRANAALATLGPLLAVGREGFPISVEGGSGPTILSRSEFDTKDFGDVVQFTSHIGFYWDIAKHWRASYRFQHMSNAGISSSNPGINLHMLAFSYRF